MSIAHSAPKRAFSQLNEHSMTILVCHSFSLKYCSWTVLPPLLYSFITYGIKLDCLAGTLVQDFLPLLWPFHIKVFFLFWVACWLLNLQIHKHHVHYQAISQLHQGKCIYNNIQLGHSMNICAFFSGNQLSWLWAV